MRMTYWLKENLLLPPKEIVGGHINDDGHLEFPSSIKHEGVLYLFEKKNWYDIHYRKASMIERLLYFIRRIRG